MPNIYAYVDYRKYLADYYHERKTRDPKFSHRYFLKKADVKTPSLLNLIIKGERSLSPNMIFKFIHALSLKEKEGVYFRLLVQFNQARTGEEKNVFYREIKSLGHLVHQKIIGAEMYEYFDRWYNPVIRELVCGHDFNNDFERLAKLVSPEITLKEAKGAVQFLLKNNFIRPKRKGGYEQIDPAIDAGDNITSLAARNFSRQMIELAKQGIDRYSLKERYNRMLTVGISPECYGMIVAEIRAFNDRIVTLVNDDPAPNAVYQLNVNLFPVSKPIVNPKGAV